MISRSSLYIFLLQLLLLGHCLAKELSSEAMDSLSEVTVQHQGRLKPLETFSRHHMLSYYEKSQLPDQNALQWLSHLVFEPSLLESTPVFRIRNPDVIAALNIPTEDSSQQIFHFKDLVKSLTDNEDLLLSLEEKAEGDLDPTERQLLALSRNAYSYDSLSHSLDLLRARYSVRSPALARALNVKPGEYFSFLKLKQSADTLDTLITEIEQRGQKELQPEETELSELLTEAYSEFHGSAMFTLPILPPPAGAKDPSWLSPSAVLQNTLIDPHYAPMIDQLEKACTAYKQGDNASFIQSIESFKSLVQPFTPSSHSPGKIKAELFMNKASLFHKSIAFYILTFLLILAYWLTPSPRLLLRAAFVMLFIGLILHGAGLALRMYILERPPVSSLYESFIFVGFITVLFSLILEKFTKNGIGLLTGSVIGSILHFIGFKYEADGDTMGMLVAVLNSNFWLATHVTTITIGYACAVVAAVVGHVYLFLQITRASAKEQLKSLDKTLLILGLIALFFTLLGTVLGGIWADQSWGRFWGWDPKENGALLIVLWLLVILHARVAGQIRSVFFAAGLAMGNIAVALAWFGVNLLSVGLHSYGFTSGIALNLALFCGGEFVFIALMTTIAYRQKNRVELNASS